MPGPCSIRPDREFLGRILGEGGEDVKKCVQCGTCSVVCDQANGGVPFPRKEMIWAQWGLKARLVADPDIWLCFQCNDCTTRCPRGARPGDVLAALRRESVKHYAFPRFLGGWVNQLKALPLILLIPAVLLGLALAVKAPLEKALGLEGPAHGFYAGFFPHWLLIGFFSLFTGLTFLAAAAGVVRFWQAMKAADASSGRNTPALAILPGLVRTLKSILGHDKFGNCTSRTSRRWAHLAAFYGFTALFVVTVWAVIDLYVNPVLGIDAMYPFGPLHPMKILANIGCVLLIFGCVKAIMDRLGSRETAGTSTSFDWIFVWLLLGVAVTGLLTEILRFAADPGKHAAAAAERTPLQHVAFAVYFVHLVAVFDLLVYLPYSKFAHVLYRTVALVYAEHSGRGKGAFPKA